MADFKVLFIVLLMFLAAVVSEGTLSKSDKKKKKKIKEITPVSKIIINFFIFINLILDLMPSQGDSVGSEAAVKTVIERELVSTKVKYADIIKNHKLYSTNTANKRQLPETMMSLGYVTPVSLWWGAPIN